MALEMYLYTREPFLGPSIPPFKDQKPYCTVPEQCMVWAICHCALIVMAFLTNRRYVTRVKPRCIANSHRRVSWLIRKGRQGRCPPSIPLSLGFVLQEYSLWSEGTSVKHQIVTEERDTENVVVC